MPREGEEAEGKKEEEEEEKEFFFFFFFRPSTTTNPSLTTRHAPQKPLQNLPRRAHLHNPRY